MEVDRFGGGGGKEREGKLLNRGNRRGLRGGRVKGYSGGLWRKRRESRKIGTRRGGGECLKCIWE